ncbi:MAG: SDR family NAD(P)-dependent oxidoreductase [Gaiellaceae bacterium]
MSDQDHGAMTPIAELVRLDGRAAVVTGGAQGIGFGIAFRLAEAGAAVLVADLDEAAAVSAAADLNARGWRAEPCGADVSDEAGVVAMVEAARSVFGGIDVLVNNAGIFPSVPIARMSAADFDRVIAVNLRGLFLCTKHVAELMIEQARGGRIINVTSIDALHPSMIGLAHYDASKHGAWGFTKNSALELAPHGIWVNAIAPGGIATPGVQAMQPAVPTPEAVDARQAVEAFLARIPMRRMGEPDEIGKVALFLASDLATYLTGSQIVVDGGALLS